MSRYAYLVCKECRHVLWLGKAVYDGTRLDFFAVGQIGAEPNAKNAELCAVVWKFLAEHASHELKVTVEGDSDFDHWLDQSVDIGGDGVDDVSFPNYLKGWRGLSG